MNCSFLKPQDSMAMVGGLLTLPRENEAKITGAAGATWPRGHGAGVQRNLCHPLGKRCHEIWTIVTEPATDMTNSLQT